MEEKIIVWSYVKKGKDISHVAESEVDSDDSYDVGSVEQHFVADSSSSESDDSYKIASLKNKKKNVDKNVRPVAQKHRRVPFHLRDKLESELQCLEAANVIIGRVESATDWVSPIVIAPKKDSTDIRMCVDMVEPNRAIKRIRHVIPTVDELRHDVNGAKVFSKLDLNHGFHQLELDEDSRDITTFSAYVGLFRYCRLNFGSNSAPEIFHEELRKKLKGIPGVRNIHDDILVTGKNVEDHNRNLKATFQRLHDSGLTLKRSKCIFSQKSIKFFGLVFSEDGVSPDPDKVDALQNLRAPTNQTQLRSFLGMTNYSSQFIQNNSTLSEPLRELKRKTTRWVWTDKHQKCFETLKEALKSNALLNYYDPSCQLRLFVMAHLLEGCNSGPT